ncbi:hypothetical protein SAMN02982929_06857 [Saccharopolyspora kobensis]|uniref:Uncharacterized protein n=1 Tax=Saccharopolyspora kobensis TaxID=146035 RepID=A0A1H6EKU1_9PSEU|nr:hypothetical protein SAMN02982929_06857 [Saccharopolyspora kobensis]SFE92297.1 hypothetical protein SAMN05216506_1166 [Saccharopolyspora kobensis]
MSSRARGCGWRSCISAAVRSMPGSPSSRPRSSIPSARSERIAQLLRFGRVAEVRAMAEAGDRVAARRLRQAERERDRAW